MSAPPTGTKKQLLHLVLGGELTNLGGTEFKDLDKVDIVGVFPNYATAYVAWKSRHSRLSTTPICAISSSTCIACSIPKPPDARPLSAEQCVTQADDRLAHVSGCHGRWWPWYLRLVWLTSRTVVEPDTMSTL